MGDPIPIDTGAKWRGGRWAAVISGHVFRCHSKAAARCLTNYGERAKVRRWSRRWTRDDRRGA